MQLFQCAFCQEQCCISEVYAHNLIVERVLQCTQAQDILLAVLHSQLFKPCSTSSLSFRPDVQPYPENRMPWRSHSEYSSPFPTVQLNPSLQFVLTPSCVRTQGCQSVGANALSHTMVCDAPDPTLCLWRLFLKALCVGASPMHGPGGTHCACDMFYAYFVIVNHSNSVSTLRCSTSRNLHTVCTIGTCVQ